jgi:hypothetical protein
MLRFLITASMVQVLIVLVKNSSGTVLTAAAKGVLMQDWKLSIGTAGAIGLRHLKTDAPPTTAYIMLGNAACATALSAPRPGPAPPGLNFYPG